VSSEQKIETTHLALVTGATKGMGREIALHLADSASGVAVHYHNNKEEAQLVVEEIQHKGKLGAAFRADLTNEKEVDALIKEVEAQFGQIDILVNNVGPFLVKRWQELNASDWDFIFRSVLESAFFCMKAVLPGMRERKWGRIINIGYHRAEQLVAFPTITPYAIAKTGLLILTRTVAASEVSSGITINMVSPGLIEGGVLPSSTKLPTANLGKFGDVAEAVLFLASEKASAITGANLIVAGTWKL